MKAEKQLEKLREWLQKQINKCEREIDRGGPFHDLEARKDAFEETLERTY
jgi:hypothetical protein